MQRTSNNNLSLLSKFLIWMTIGFVALLNMQPWISLARHIAKEITNIPFLEFLIEIPFLGGWIELFFLNLIPVLGMVLWGITQYMQVLPAMVGQTTPSMTLYRWVSYVFEGIVCFLQFPPYEGGIEGIQQDFPNIDGSLIDWWTLAVFALAMGGFEALFYLSRNVRESFR